VAGFGVCQHCATALRVLLILYVDGKQVEAMLASGEQPDAASIVQPPEDSSAVDEVAGQEGEVGSSAADSAANSGHTAGGTGQTVSTVDDSSTRRGTHDLTEL